MAAIPPGPVEGGTTIDPRRKTLSVAVAAILQDAGFLAFEKAALGTLTEMLQSCELQYNPIVKYYTMCLLPSLIDGLYGQYDP